MRRNQYKVTGYRSPNGQREYSVVMFNGAIEYDCLETRKLAIRICMILNDGIGPEWDRVEAEMRKRGYLKA